MTEGGLALVLTRMYAVWLAVGAVQLSTMVAASVVSVIRASSPLQESITATFPLLVGVAAGLFWAVLLWVKAPAVADAVCRDSAVLADTRPAASATLEGVGFRLLGAYFLVTGVTGLLGFVARWAAFASQFPDADKYWRGSAATWTEDVLQVAAGLFLFLGSSGLINGLRLLRTAGQAKGQPEG